MLARKSGAGGGFFSPCLIASDHGMFGGNADRAEKAVRRPIAVDLAAQLPVDAGGDQPGAEARLLGSDKIVEATFDPVDFQPATPPIGGGPPSEINAAVACQRALFGGVGSQFMQHQGKRLSG